MSISAPVHFHTAPRAKPNVPEDVESQGDFERYTAIKEDAALAREAEDSNGGVKSHAPDVQSVSAASVKSEGALCDEGGRGTESCYVP